MKQQEMFVPPAILTSVVCGSEKRVQLKHGVKVSRCPRVVHLHPGIDRRYLTGTCSLCGKDKTIKSPGESK